MSARCDRCRVGLRYLLVKAGDRVLCASCASGGATEMHHIAGRKIAPWVVPIDINLHRVVSRLMTPVLRDLGYRAGVPLPDLPPENTLLGLIGQVLWVIVGMIQLYQALKILEAAKETVP